MTTSFLSWAGNVRVRAQATDPYHGLRGHAYIAARGLNKPVQRVTPVADCATITQQPHACTDFFFASGTMEFLPEGARDRRFFAIPAKRR